MLQRKKCVYFFERTVFETSLGKGAAGTLAPFEGEFAGKVQSILEDPWSSRVQRKPQPVETFELESQAKLEANLSFLRFKRHKPFTSNRCMKTQAKTLTCFLMQPVNLCQAGPLGSFRAPAVCQHDQAGHEESSSGEVLLLPDNKHRGGGGEWGQVGQCLKNLSFRFS